MRHLHRNGFFLTFTLVLAIAGLSRAGAEEAIDWSGATSVDIVMSNFEFAPDSLRLKAGTPYKLHFVNKSARAHTFSSPDLFAASTVDPRDQSRIQDGEIEVDGGQSATLNVIPRKAGTFDLRCTEPLHALFGMTGKIIVE